MHYSSLLDLALSAEEDGRAVKSEVVRAALEQHRKEQAEKASSDIVALLKDMDKHKLESRAKIRKLKANLATVVNSLKVMDRAWAYAEETSNFLPVLACFGRVAPHDLPNPDDFQRLTTVPADWQPATEE